MLDELSARERNGRKIDSEVTERDDIVSLRFSLVYRLLDRSVKIASVFARIEVVKQVAVFIHEESRRRFRDAFRCADADESYFDTPFFNDLVSRKNGSSVLGFVETARNIGEISLVYEL